jgi:hypothetical protein
MRYVTKMELYKREYVGHLEPKRSAVWITMDNLWQFRSDYENGSGWMIRAYWGEDPDADNKWLQSLGLSQARFSTRKEAVGALEQALKATN